MRSQVLAFVLLGAVGCSGGSNSTDAGQAVDAGSSTEIDPRYQFPDGGLRYDATCSKPGTQGNSLGVGHFCRVSSDCSGLPALFCTTLGGPDVNQWFCTFPCSCNSQCGEGALCASGSGGSGCTPIVCDANDPGIVCYPDGGPITDGGADGG
jgi:hypothetical protein